LFPLIALPDPPPLLSAALLEFPVLFPAVPDPSGLAAPQTEPPPPDLETGDPVILLVAPAPPLPPPFGPGLPVTPASVAPPPPPPP